MRAERTPRTRRQWCGASGTCPQLMWQAGLPLSREGQDPLTPKGSCLTSGTDPKGLTHLLQKFWRSCLVPVLLQPRESGEKMWKPVGSGEAHRTELASRMQLCKWLTRRQNQARLSGAAIFHPQTPAAGVGHPCGPSAEICYDCDGEAGNANSVWAVLPHRGHTVMWFLDEVVTPQVPASFWGASRVEWKEERT